MDLEGLAEACAHAEALPSSSSSSSSPVKVRATTSPSSFARNPLLRALDGSATADGRPGLRRLKVQLSRLLSEEEDENFQFWQELPKHYAEAIVKFAMFVNSNVSFLFAPLRFYFRQTMTLKARIM